jgi:hypothetical protein
LTRDKKAQFFAAKPHWRSPVCCYGKERKITETNPGPLALLRERTAIVKSLFNQRTT